MPLVIAAEVPVPIVGLTVVMFPKVMSKHFYSNLEKNLVSHCSQK